MFGKISTGALSDLEKVTKQAYAMVTIYGLNKRLGNISYYDSQGRDMFTKPYSDDTAKIIDEEVSSLIESQYQRALTILRENRKKLVELADKLLTDEVIFKENLEAVFGKRPWEPAEIPASDTAVNNIESPVEDLAKGPSSESESADAVEDNPDQNRLEDPQ
jgi:cell division protease FtsH